MTKSQSVSQSVKVLRLKIIKERNRKMSSCDLSFEETFNSASFSFCCVVFQAIFLLFRSDLVNYFKFFFFILPRSDSLWDFILLLLRLLGTKTYIWKGKRKGNLLLIPEVETLVCSCVENREGEGAGKIMLTTIYTFQS